MEALHICYVSLKCGNVLFFYQFVERYQKHSFRKKSPVN